MSWNDLQMALKQREKIRAVIHGGRPELEHDVQWAELVHTISDLASQDNTGRYFLLSYLNGCNHISAFVKIKNTNC